MNRLHSLAEIIVGEKLEAIDSYIENAPEFKDAIFVRDNIRCPNCGNFGMNYMTKGKIGYGINKNRKKYS